MRRLVGTDLMILPVVHQVGDRSPVVTPARGYHLDELERALPKAEPPLRPAPTRWAGMSIAGRIDAVRTGLGDGSWYIGHLRSLGATTADIVEAIVILDERGDEAATAWLARRHDAPADRGTLRAWLVSLGEGV